MHTDNQHDAQPPDTSAPAWELTPEDVDLLLQEVIPSYLREAERQARAADRYSTDMGIALRMTAARVDMLADKLTRNDTAIDLWPTS